MECFVHDFVAMMELDDKNELFCMDYGMIKG